MNQYQSQYKPQYQPQFYPNNQIIDNQDRQFVFPFLVGAVTGGAAIGLTRPRPVYVNQPYRPYPLVGYGYYNYGYYNPYYR